MSPQDIRVLGEYRLLIERAGIKPTMTFIARRTGLPVRVVRSAVDRLVVTGALAKEPRKVGGVSLQQQHDLGGVSSARMIAVLQDRGDIVGAFATTPRPVRDCAKACASECCDIEVTFGRWFCRDHWFSIDKDLRDELLAAYSRARRTRSDEDVLRYQDLFGQARDQTGWVLVREAC